MQDHIRNIQDAREREAHLLRELAKSAALQELWPDVFEHGPATSRVVTRAARQRLGSRFDYPQAFASLIVTNGAGESRTFHGDAVPELLRSGFPLEPVTRRSAGR